MSEVSGDEIRRACRAINWRVSAYYFPRKALLRWKELSAGREVEIYFGEHVPCRVTLLDHLAGGSWKVEAETLEEAAVRAILAWDDDEKRRELALETLA